MTQVLVISDTHVKAFSELPEGIQRAVRGAEWVVHCGDFTSVGVLEELRRLTPHFVGVFGNADPSNIRQQLSHQVTFELEERKIVVVHPHWGGHPDGLEKELALRFPDADVILFGHTHETCNLKLKDTLLLNPGQGYASFMIPASMAVLTVSQSKLSGELLTLADVEGVG
ncbi:MAG: YfcE family phosphodiesterase [Dehalococcoidales bacterium]|nr:MAG: YfcE family phosphodiesterase [Dehalococcoidales bacterium]